MKPQAGARARARCRLLTYLTCLTYAASAAAMPEKPLHYVSDFAGILEDSVEAGLNARIKGLQDRGIAELAVVTVGSLEGQEPKAYANELFKKWGIGQKGKNNGVLILVAPNERKIWIEVGYGLEPILPDGLAGEVIREQFLPAFKRGDYPGGIAAGTERVAEIVEKGEPAGMGAAFRTEKLDPASEVAFTLIIGTLFAGSAGLAGLGAGGGGFLFVLVGITLGFMPFFLLYFESWPWGFAIFNAAGVAAFICGYRKASAYPSFGGGRWSSTGGSWDFGGSSDYSSGGGSSFGGFGGGSSGGGGAGGSW